MGDVDDVRLVSVEEVSTLMSLSRSQIGNLLRRGLLPGVRFTIPGTVRAKWLIPLKALREFIAKNSTGTAT